MTDTVGCTGAFAPSSRGQPMMVFGAAGPFYVFDPRPEDLDIEVIAHSLSLRCRFGGQIRTFYSVAQHSVIASYLCPNYPREGLMHDAAEAYIGDMIRPLKMHMPDFAAAERVIEIAIARRWGLEWPWPAEVKQADNIMLATEKRDLCVPNDLDWGPLPDPMPAPIEPWPWEGAKRRFLERAEQLGIF